MSTGHCYLQWRAGEPGSKPCIVGNMQIQLQSIAVRSQRALCAAHLRLAYLAPDIVEAIAEAGSRDR